MTGAQSQAQAPHVPVLIDEVIASLRIQSGETHVDGTFGAGGYTRALLGEGAGRVIAFDRDPQAIEEGRSLVPDSRLILIHDRFSTFDRRVPSCEGVTFDLGVSSMQLDEAERGFSFMRDGPLDMRMGADGQSAADLVNTAEHAELARIIYVYGEERQSRRIASAIIRRREAEPFARTLDLAEVVERALGGRKGAKVHPATRTFQALRIAVNEELTELEEGLVAAERALVPGGRLAVVTFHSLEDRIVKAFFTERAGRTPSGSRHLPPQAAGRPPSFSMIFNGARAPSDEEVAANPRARSAKLRAARRTEAAAWGAAA